MLSQAWVGRTIAGRYKLESLLGAGGMSAVYRAVDPNLRRIVAVKLIHPHLSVNPNFVERFKEEAAAVASLRHPNIVQVHDFNNDGETFYMVMEYLAGETLQARLRRVNAAGRHLPLDEAVRISQQVCDAASYAHHHDLVHRDIKPANIMLDVQGQAILMDFGIVKIVGGQYHTATGATIGTAIYMSPEQIRGERVDERCDIYSMGVMLFEMLSGRPPYEADSALTLMMMHLNDPIPDPCDLRADIPPELAAVVIKALAKDRNQRYQTAAEMAADLRRIQPTLAALVEGATALEGAQTQIGTPVEAAPTRAMPTVETPPTARETVQAADEAPPAPPAPFAPTLPMEEAAEAAAPGQAGFLSPAAQAVTLPLEESAVEAGLPVGAGLAESGEASQPDGAIAGLAGVGAGLDSSGEARQPARNLPLRRILLIAGLLLVVLLAVGGVWLFNQRKPPAEQLMPIERPSIPITLETQSRLVSLGEWHVDALSTDLAFSLDTDFLASASNRDWVRYSPYRFYASQWQVASGALQAHLLDHSDWMKSLDFSPDGELLATSSEDAKIDLWPARPAEGQSTSEPLRTIESETGGVASLDFSPNGRLLAGATWDGAGLWQVSNGNLLRTYRAGESGMSAVAFSPDGELLVGGSGSGEIYLWRASDGELVATLRGHTAEIKRLAFSPDGLRLASGSDDHFVKLWQVSSAGEEGANTLLATLSGHVDGVTDVVFSPDGSLLVSSSWDGTLRLWQAEDGRAVRTIEMGESIYSLAFSPDGAWLAGGSGEGFIRFLGVSSDL